MMTNKEKAIKEEMKSNDLRRIHKPKGYYSNRVIRARNGGVRHQFENSIGGCSSNYR